MSSKMNHRKRSRYSEHMKGGAYHAQSRKAYYRFAGDYNNRGVLGLLGRLFHRRVPKQNASSQEKSAET